MVKLLLSDLIVTRRLTEKHLSIDFFCSSMYNGVSGMFSLSNSIMDLLLSLKLLKLQSADTIKKFKSYSESWKVISEEREKKLERNCNEYQEPEKNLTLHLICLQWSMQVYLYKCNYLAIKLN